MQFLEPDELGTTYQLAQTTARKSWIKYDEYERLANNEVRTDLPANMPKVNDGSLAATIRKVPKRIMAKPMSGKLKATDRDEDWVAKLATVILEQRIIPNANTDAPFLSKWQTALKNALIYGSQPIYTFFTQHGTYTGADFSVPYVKNVYLEPGKVSDMASDFIFMDSYYTKLQARRLVDKAKEDAQSVTDGNLEEGDVIWDAKNLQAWYDAGPQGKDSQSMTREERKGINQDDKGLYKLVTCFNRGYEAPFYTFAPNIADRVCGTQKNTNPTGDVPIIFLYADEDLINPYGTGLVQVAGPTQNVLDNLTQTDVLATQIGNQPPIDIHGDRSSTNLKSLVYSPNAFWFSGNATITPIVAVNPTMYNALPNRFGLYKSQMQYQTGTFDNSVSAESGNPGFSKTDAGVNALQNVTNADDNFMLQRVGEAYSRAIKSMVNIHMNNMEGTELLKLEGDQIELLATTELVPTDENGEPMTEQIEVVWDHVRGSFDFTVDFQSSLKTNDMEQAANIQQAIAQVTPQVSYYMGQDGYKFNLGAAYHSLLSTMRLENIDKIITKMTPEEKQQAAAAPFPIIDPPQIRINSADVPPEYVPGMLQNAGITAGQEKASPSYEIQAKLMDAQTKAFIAHNQATQIQAGMVEKIGAPNQPIGLDENGNPLPDPNAQATAGQKTAQPNNAQEEATEPVQNQQEEVQEQPAPQPPMHQNPQQRLMEIESQYDVDPETAAGILAAEDHGVSPEEYLSMIAEHQGTRVWAKPLTS